MIQPHLVFLHGGPGFRDYLRPYFSSLEPAFACTFYDQLQGQVSLDELISQLDAIVSTLSGPRILVGHSWGGTLAIEYGARHEAKIDGMVIMCSPLSARHWNDEYRRELERRGLTKPTMEQIFFAEDEKELGSRFLPQILASFSSETFASFDQYTNTYDLTGILGHFSKPIINIFAEHDIRVPPIVARSFRSFNPRILDIEIKGAGHFPFLRNERRNEIHRVLSDNFLSPS